MQNNLHRVSAEGDFIAAEGDFTATSRKRRGGCEHGTNAFRLRKATYFNQAAGARSTEGLHGIAQRAYGIHSEGMAWNHRQGRCMSLPRSGGWNPRNARHVITDKVILGGGR